MTRQPVPKLSKPGVGAVLQKSFRLLRGHAQHFFLVAAVLIFPLTLISSLVHTPTFNSIVDATPGLIFTLVPKDSPLSVLRNPGDLHQSLLDFPTHFNSHSRRLLEFTDTEGSLLGIKVKDDDAHKSGFMDFFRGIFFGSAEESKNLTLPDNFAVNASTEAFNSIPESQENVSLSSQQIEGDLSANAETKDSAEDEGDMLASFTSEKASQLFWMLVLIVCDLGAWVLLKCVSEAAVATSVAGSYLGTLAGLPGQPKKVFFTRDYFRSLWHASGRVFVTVLALGSLFSIIDVLLFTTLIVEYSVLMLLLNVPALTVILLAMTFLFFGVVAIHVLIVTTLAPTVSVLEGKYGWGALARSAYLIRNSRKFSTTFLLKVIMVVVQHLLLGLGLNALLFAFIDFIARLLMGHKSVEEFARSEGVVKIPWMVINYDILFNNTVATAVTLFTIVVNTVLLFFCKTGCGEHLGEKVTFGGGRELTELVRDNSTAHKSSGPGTSYSPSDSLLEFVSPATTHATRHGGHGP